MSLTKFDLNVNPSTVASLKRKPLPLGLRHVTPWAQRLPMHVITSIVQLGLDVDATPAAMATAIRTAAQFGEEIEHRCAICHGLVGRPFVPNIVGMDGRITIFATCLECEKEYSDAHDAEEAQP